MIYHITEKVSLFQLEKEKKINTGLPWCLQGPWHRPWAGEVRVMASWAYGRAKNCWCYSEPDSDACLSLGVRLAWYLRVRPREISCTPGWRRGAQGARKPELFLESAWKEAKLEQNLYLRVKMCSWGHVSLRHEGQGRGQMSHHICRSPNSHPQGMGQS